MPPCRWRQLEIQQHLGNPHQLTGETSTEATPVLDNSYTYDASGNRVAASVAGDSSSFTLDNMNQVSSYAVNNNSVAVAYDDNGNTTHLGNQVMSYDEADRLTAVIKKDPISGQNVQKTEYEYDGQSRRRIAKVYSWNAENNSWTQQSERRFIYDGMDLVEERDGSNNVVASYVRDGNIGGVLSMTNDDGTFYYHYDGNGNVVALTNSSGAIAAEYSYDAYGNLQSSSGSEAAKNPFRFSTKYFDDNTGYYDFGFRSYNPVTGRWLNTDPIGESGSLNLYGFVGNSPGNKEDGYGLEPYTYLHELTSDIAFGWYTNGQGRALAISFNKINTKGLLPTDFKEVQRVIGKDQVGCHRVDTKKSFNVTGKLAPVLGHITLRLLGNLSLRYDGSWVFHGQLRAYADTYNFDANSKKNRGMVGETLTHVGHIATGLSGGQQYNIYMPGSKAMVEVGARQVMPQRTGVGESPARYLLYLKALKTYLGGQ